MRRIWKRVGCLLLFCLLIGSIQISAADKTSGKSTLKQLLQTALQPVGSTMYVWGGAWNIQDVAAGMEAKTIGVGPTWKEYFMRQTRHYDYRKTRYQIHNGLDCSGYVGWCIYNILNTKNGRKGYVMPAEWMAEYFAAWGWGEYTDKRKVKSHRPGDIMSSSGHVYIVVGECADGSVVLMHSSPPGVQISGTATPRGKANSQAVRLARKYMKKYFPKWYKKYPENARGVGYLRDYHRMRWDLSGKTIMTDPDGYRNMSAKQVLKDLFAGK
ncbi:MAG: hypothetical protein Q4B57_07145 [Eubacteriales bacterium]|nr:hypothetical protein [Eubacteriales bacterium]